MRKSEKCVELFKSVGSEWDVSEQIKVLAEEFVCELYGYKDTKDINLLQYKIYCSKCGKCECEQLPPCRSSLLKHISRANYQTRIWRLSLQTHIEAPNPVLHGWKMLSENDEEQIEIDWMDCKPAPDEVSLHLFLNYICL